MAVKSVAVLRSETSNILTSETMCFVDDTSECDLVLGGIVLQTSVDICSFDIAVVRLAYIGCIARSLKLILGQKGASSTALSLSAGSPGYGHLQ